MDMIIDTQVVSYQFKNLYIETGAHNIVVTSITANEFLLAQPSKNNSPKYYVLHPKKYKSLVNASLSKDKTQISNEYFKNPRWAKQGSRRTDQIVIDFNNQFLPCRKFGSSAISEVINSKLPYFYGYCIAHLSKKDQKLLQKRFKFISDQNYYCLPINHSIIEIGLELFAQFTKNIIQNSISETQ